MHTQGIIDREAVLWSSEISGKHHLEIGDQIHMQQYYPSLPDL